MSSKKCIETKILDDENTDSGFLSGPLSEQQLSKDLDTTEDSDSRKLVSENLEELDSGLDLCLSECLSNVKISDSTQFQQMPSVTVLEDKIHDIPPFAILFQQDDDGDTQLHIAAVHGCEKSVGTLISICPDKAWLDVPNDYGHTALHLAVMSGHAVVTRMLVRAGVSLAVRDLNGDTPLHIASASKHVECLQALLAPIPEHPPRKLTSILNQKNYNGQSCVHLAAALGYIETLQTLVYYGADINAREGLAGCTALHVAARRGHVSVVQWLVSRCSGVSLRARDYAGRTPRRVASRSHVAALLPAATDSDSDTHSEDDTYDSDTESLFEKLRDNMNAINVA